ncbi:MAG: hypothetical protein HKM29_01950 [Deltaproteobacteria bacterium]|nr:hypothetical protein [Deltaproteobacteria bacterium]
MVAITLLFLFFSLMTAPSLTAYANNVTGGARGYEERSAAEKHTRSRFRRLEWASLVLILAAGGGAIYWVVRRK